MLGHGLAHDDARRIVVAIGVGVVAREPLKAYGSDIAKKALAHGRLLRCQWFRISARTLILRRLDSQPARQRPALVVRHLAEIVGRHRVA